MNHIPKLLPLFLVTLLTLLFEPKIQYNANAQQRTDSIAFNDLFNDRFASNRISSVRWMNGGRFFSTLSNTGEDVELRKNDIISGRYQVLIRQSDLRLPSGKTIDVEGYTFSADEQKVLIETNVESIYRRSTIANYYIYSLPDDSLYRLANSQDKLQYAAFSPQGNRVAFVRHNNLYWVDLKTGTEHTITTDGEEGSIINGATDWVYEEEFSFAKAWFWAPDGSKIAFYRFDESDVKEYTLQKWNGTYPNNITYKYPKAGEANSKVSIGVYHLDKDSTVWMDTDAGQNKNQYIVRVNWTHDSNKLAIRGMNRLQSRQDLLLANANSGTITNIKTETNRAWIEENNDLTFLENGQEFLYVSEESGFNHIYHYRMDGKLIKQITSGPWEVSRFIGFDEVSNRLYYTSTEESPLQRHLYSISISGKDKRRLTMQPGWHSIMMNPDLTYFIDSHSTANKPGGITLYDNKGEPVRRLAGNERLKEVLQNVNLPQKEFLNIPINDSLALNGYLIKPADFDPEKKYPVLVYVYGGPGSQTVTNRYSGGQREIWHRYLAQNGYLIFSVDNRGTGGRGEAFKKAVYKKLGQLEARDQIAAAKVLAAKPYVDENRMGIWGWSYGGYMSSLALARGGDVYKMAISVAPVSDWRFYDTIYTERYMQTPRLNEKGYQQSSVLNEVSGMAGKPFLLVHGTGDDNVHVQNSYELVDALVEENIEFDTMMYPDRAHSIAGGNTRKHLYKKLTDFVMSNL